MANGSSEDLLRESNQPAPEPSRAPSAGMAPPPRAGAGMGTSEAIWSESAVPAQMAQQFMAEDEPQVMVGWKDEPTPPQIGIGMSEGDPTRPIFGHGAGGPGGTQMARTPQMVSVNEQARSIFRMPRTDLVSLQNRLFAAGFYGSASYENVNFGAPGPDTYAAYTKFLQESTEWSELGSDDPMPWWEVLDTLAGAGTDMDERLSAARGGGPGGAQPEPTNVVSLADPAALRQVFQEAQTDVLGKRISAEEQQKFVALIHNLQRKASNAAFTAQTQGGGGSVEVMSPDPRAQAQEMARRADPERARAHDVSKVYEGFLDLLGGRGRG